MGTFRYFEVSSHKEVLRAIPKVSEASLRVTWVLHALHQLAALKIMTHFERFYYY